MIRFRPLVSDEARLAFQDGYNAATGDQFAIARFPEWTYYGGYNRHGELIGGYALAPEPIMRWPEIVPREPVFLQQHERQRMVELNLVWLARNQRRRLMAAVFWLALSRSLGRIDAAYITFAVAAHKFGLLRLYRKVVVGEIYAGGMTSPHIQEGTVFYTTPQRFRRVPLLYARDLLARALGLLPKAASVQPPSLAQKVPEGT